MRSLHSESSAALGFGFRCGFLGLRIARSSPSELQREFNLYLITTAPSVIYHLHMNEGTMIVMHNPADMPDVVKDHHIRQTMDQAMILVPMDHLGAVLKLCRGIAAAARSS